MALVDVKHVSHVALRAQDIDRQAAFYSQLVGLGETERDSEGRVYLRCNANHHSVVLMPSDRPGIDHFALDVGSPAAVESAATALAGALVRTLSKKESDALTPFIRPYTSAPP